MTATQRLCVWHPAYFPEEPAPEMAAWPGTCCRRCFIMALQEVADERLPAPDYAGVRGCAIKVRYPTRHRARQILHSHFAPSSGIHVYRCPYSRPRHYHLGHVRSARTFQGRGLTAEETTRLLHPTPDDKER